MLIITLQDIKQRFEDFLEIIKNQGIELVKTKDGETLGEALEKLKEENKALKKENEELKKNIITKEEFERRLGGGNNFDKNGIYKGGSADSQTGGTSGSSGDSDEEKA